jgi:hypothetical protein
VAKFSRHFDRTPDRLGMEEVRAYVTMIELDRSQRPILERDVHDGQIVKVREELVAIDPHRVTRLQTRLR